MTDPLPEGLRPDLANISIWILSDSKKSLLEQIKAVEDVHEPYVRLVDNRTQLLGGYRWTRVTVAGPESTWVAFYLKGRGKVWRIGRATGSLRAVPNLEELLEQVTSTFRLGDD